MNCPRCSSLTFRDATGAVGCPLCGWERVTPAEMAEARRQMAMDRDPRTGKMRRSAQLQRWGT